jgi:hypothetical protein
MSDSQNNLPKPHKIAASAVPAPSKFSSWREHFARERRWFAETFSKEKMVDMFKQLAWVVPLTLLIWIYAEREQIATLPNETIPFQLVSPDPNKTVELIALRSEGAGAMERQDSNLVLELQGPRARLQNVLQRLRGGMVLQGLRLEIDRNLSAGEHLLPTSALLGGNSVFAQNGITVTRVQPERLRVRVDDLVEREAKVIAPPGVTTLDAGTQFNPPTVKIKGPSLLLDRAKNEAGGLTVFARIPDDLLATPGEKDARKIPIDLPQALAQDDRVTPLRQDVDAVLHVRAADAEYPMSAMPISLDVPPSLSDKVVVTMPSTSLPDVTLIGPKDKIDQLNDPNYQQKPYAQLTIRSNDVGKDGLRRKLRFVDLPPGVRVKDDQREVTFSVKSKADADQ